MRLNNIALTKHIEEMLHSCTRNLRAHKIKDCIFKNDAMEKLKELYRQHKWMIETSND